MTIAPFSLRMSPGAATTTSPRSREVLTVTNAGSKPLRIVTSTQSITRSAGSCHLGRSAFTAKFSPATFTLEPGHAERVRVTITAPSSATGTHDVVLVASGTTDGSVKSTVAVHGAVTSLLQVSLPGRAQVAACAHLAASPRPPVPASGSDTGYLAGGGGILALMALAALVAGRRRARRARRRGRHTAPPDRLTALVEACQRDYARLERELSSGAERYLRDPEGWDRRHGGNPWAESQSQ